MMNIIWWLVFGTIAGAIAKIIMPGKQNMGWLMTALLGIIGSIVGGYVGSLIFGKEVTNSVFSIYSMGMSVLGALLILFIYGKVVEKK